MEVFLLGAGKPASGQKPAALKKIALNTRALDWQIHSFDTLHNVQIRFLGGYHVEEIAGNYPQLSYTLVPDWEHHTVLHTFFQAPFSYSPTIIAYTDTVFRKEMIQTLTQSSADISFAIDTRFKQRFESRSTVDLASAEIMRLENFNVGEGEAEFTGLIYFKPEVIAYLKTINECPIGNTLLDLLRHLKLQGFSLEAIDAHGHWAEFNAPADIAHFILGTKAETLERLKPLVRYSHIGEQVTFTTCNWQNNAERILSNIQKTFKGARLIIRSSAKSEDSWDSSNAGSFDSQLNIDGQSELEIKRAITAVIHSYGAKADHTIDQILVQAFVQNVAMAGVVFTCGLETGSPYYRFNFDDQTQSTESVTSGLHDALRNIILYRNQTQYLKNVEPALIPVLEAIQELEKLLGFDKLDIEFAIDQSGKVHIFQIRPITVDHSQYDVTDDTVTNSLSQNVAYFQKAQQATPFTLGGRTFFGNMPDWNPAEIIGARPHPLAFSLYRYLVTDEIWATQRAEFGYRDVRPHPLIISFSGQPYVDIRASLNSFIPAEIPNALAEKLVSVYLDILENHPEYHDKIEFNVAFTAWTPTFQKEAEERFLTYGIQLSEISILENALKKITLKAISRLDSDIQSIETLIERRAFIKSADLSALEKLYLLLDDCRRFGTLAFAHAARAGFVATTFLKSFVSANIISDEQMQVFMRQVHTVTSQFEMDKYGHAQNLLNQDYLLKQYGHLRPGTYDIHAQAYWEDPARYLISESSRTFTPSFSFNFDQNVQIHLSDVLQSIDAHLSLDQFCRYLDKAIQAREAVKFEFTRNLSESLDLCVMLGEQIGVDRKDMAYLEYSDLVELKLNTLSIETLKYRIQERKQNHIISQLIELPTLITQLSDFYCFERHASQPNFITTKKSVSPVELLHNKVLTDISLQDLSGKIILISQADPGYDWLFGQNIAGLITKYGGANSHMAIRAAEMGLPAAIGVGEKLYDSIAQMEHMELDCANRIIRKIK